MSKYNDVYKDSTSLSSLTKKEIVSKTKSFTTSTGVSQRSITTTVTTLSNIITDKLEEYLLVQNPELISPLTIQAQIDSTDGQMETLPITLNTTYTDSETGVNCSRVMEDEERIMTNLKKQHEEGKHIRYVLYHQEEAVEGIQHQSDDKDINVETQLFSPPHVVEVKDSNFRRRNSLPSYVHFESGNDEDDLPEKQTLMPDSNNTLKSSSTSSITNGKLQTMSDLMNKVVQETNQMSTRSSVDSNSKETSLLTTPPNKSPLKIRSLTCSPYVSPEKLYPEFVFTPTSSDHEDQHLATTVQSTPYLPTTVFSTDTTKETFSTAGTTLSPLSESSEPSIAIIASSDAKICQQTDLVSDAVSRKNSKLTELSFTKEKSLDHDKEMSVVLGKMRENIHVAAVKPVSLKRVARHFRTSSPLLEEDETMENGELNHESLVNEIQHVFVRKEINSPCVNPLNEGSAVSKHESMIPCVSHTPSKLMSSEDRENPEQPSLLLSPPSNNILQSEKEGTAVKPISIAKCNDVKSRVPDRENTEFSSEVDPFTSYLDSTLGNGDTLLSSSYSLVSPDRTKNLIKEATVHARRRRPSSKRSLHSKTVSESALNFYLVTNPHIMKRHTSSPLISPARQEMLIRQASERIINNRVQRRSELLNITEKSDNTEETNSNTDTLLLDHIVIDQPQIETESIAGCKKVLGQFSENITLDSSDIENISRLE